jgi:hypothetical protein
MIIYHGLFESGQFLQGQTLKVKNIKEISYWEGIFYPKEPSGFISLPQGTYTDATRLLSSFSASSDNTLSIQQQSFGDARKWLFHTEIKEADTV